MQLHKAISYFTQYDTRYITLFTMISRVFPCDVIKRSIVTSSKPRHFGAIFARKFLKNTTYHTKNLFYSNYHVIKRISNEFSFHTMFYETRCVFYIPSPRLGDMKTHNSFRKTSYEMKIHLRFFLSHDNSNRISFLYDKWCF